MSPKLRMLPYRGVTALVAAMALAIALALPLALPRSASAGGNGQQVTLTRNGPGVHVWLCGYNQGGAWTCWPYYTWLQYYNTTFPGYWWVGTVYIYRYDWGGNPRGTKTCWVPPSQSGDTTYCNVY
jgi:hypothetical protein